MNKKTERLNLRLDPALMRRLERLAERYGTDVSKLVRRILTRVTEGMK